ncbi:MAG: hypothetical protein K2N35_00960 [Muribaculaceae bacterium]|nr:hypothetical protein [Muribaculaceae bacterium]
MKKLFLTLGLAAACLTSNAYERILYNQNFETATSAEATGWSFGGESMKISSDLWGKFLDLSLGQNNGRSGQVVWGDSIYMDKDGNVLLEDNCYKLQFSFCIKNMPTNQWNSEITVFTNKAPIANNLYRIPWGQSVAVDRENFIFDAAQVNAQVDADMELAINAPVYPNYSEEVKDSITGYSYDLTEVNTVSTGAWVNVVCDVNVADRTVDYNVETETGDFIKSGTMTVPETDMDGEPISMFAEGIFALLARYQSKFLFDNIRVSCEVENPFANIPTIALTGLGQDEDENLDLNLRIYTITFLDGEVLHIKGTDGTIIEVEYDDTDEGAYQYSTTTSGVLEAWTTCEGASSEVVKMDVDCTPCKLPSVVATISAVQTGFGKTYTLTISNADVPLQPTIFINYLFEGENGEKIEVEGVASGAKVSVSEKGVLTLTSAAFGYESTTIKVDNDLEFDIKQQWDFARMSDDEIKAAGFPSSYEVLNSATTSGFDNWTARKRLYYYDSATETVNDEGETVYTAVYPFGYTGSDENVVNYTTIGSDVNVAGYELFEGITVYAGHNVRWLKNIGMINDETSGGNYKNIDVLNLDKTDFVVINKINNYGGNSCHPICATTEEYYAQLEGENEVFRAADGTLNEETGKYTVSCPVYRIDTAATCLTVYKQLGNIDDAVDVINAVAGDGYWYSIDGIRVAEPTRPGLYIHNGKKIIVK